MNLERGEGLHIRQELLQEIYYEFLNLITGGTGFKEAKAIALKDIYLNEFEKNVLNRQMYMSAKQRGAM